MFASAGEVASEVFKRLRWAVGGAVLAVLFSYLFHYAFVWLFLGVLVLWVLSGVRRLKTYTANVLRSADCVVNAVLAGEPHETVSSRIGKSYYFHHLHPAWVRRPPWWMWVIREVSEVFEPQHVFRAMELYNGVSVSSEQRAEAIILAKEGRL